MKRRPFRRRLPIGAFGRRGPGLNPAGRTVRDAHLLALNGSPDRAAKRFEELAQSAANRGGPHAPQMYLQAGRFYAQAGDYPGARSALYGGLQLLAGSVSPRRLSRVIASLAKALQRYGQMELCREVIQYGNLLLPEGQQISEIADSVDDEGGLPAKCPYCGAAVDPRDVEWLEDRTAMCEFCGSLLEA